MSDSRREVAVCCPFPHKVPGTELSYMETHPSAHVNTANNLFNCKACGAGHNEITFMQTVLNCSFIFAKKLQRCFDNDEDLDNWNSVVQLTDEGLSKINNLGISTEVAKELHMTASEYGIQFPVFMYDHLVDIRTYNPGHEPKVRSREGCPAGVIYPFDIWRMTPKHRVTVLCAGEKDMAVARSNGLNAITLTGGERALPQLLKEFEERDVVICYDNDSTGLSGARAVACKLYGVAKSVRICTGFHEICSEKGEDITDFFTKYNKTKEDLVKYLKEAPVFEPTENELEACYPIVDLLTATKPKYLNRMVRSNVQVVATSEASFVTPTIIMAEKFKAPDQDNHLMRVGEVRDWELTEQNVEAILHLIDNNFKEATIQQNIRTLLKIPLKEKYVRVKEYQRKPVHKCYVTDLFETTSSEVLPMEFTAYSLDIKLESGKKYLVTYKLVPHPYKGQQLTMLITNAVQASDSVSNFKITEETKAHLKEIQSIPGTVAEKIDNLTERVKGILGYDGNSTLIKALDLSYHTVLGFNFGNFKNVRGYLDTLIVGESRVGKSSTASGLRNTYELGTFTSLAGNSATIPGLIGGSNKVNGSYQTRAGVIPQNHKGLIIFEEFGKSNSSIIKDLTDIRSSNEVRIARVSGTITLPAMVRMITLTNVKSTDGQPRSIASYPNGIAIITELIGTAEDIARYDMLVVLADKGATAIDPLWQPAQPFDKAVYQSRIRWVWSRTADQILLDTDVLYYIVEQANELNKVYDSHIKIFGTEAWKKITRLAIAVAGYTVSTDETYENIVVTKEHVDYAVTFFKDIYDNSTFKLKEYVEHERRFSHIDEDGVAALQNIYEKHPSLVLQLEQTSSTSKNVLGAVTGLNNDELNKALTLLTKALFIRFSNHDIIPTERFRKGMAMIERNVNVKRIGEGDA